MLQNKKEDLFELKKEVEGRNDDLKKEVAAKEELALKRLKAKLEKDKNIETRELLA